VDFHSALEVRGKVATATAADHIVGLSGTKAYRCAKKSAQK